MMTSASLWPLNVTEPPGNSSNLHNSTSDPLTDTHLYSFYFFLNGIVGIIICAIGLIGNTLNLLILTNMCRRSATSTTLFLIVMGVADILVLLTYMMYDIVCNAHPARPLLRLSDLVGIEGTFAYFLYYIWYFPANIFVTTSNWCIVSVMFFRFTVVYFPLKAKTWCSMFRAKLFIGVIILFSIALMVPEFLTVKIEKSADSGFIFVDTDLFSHKLFNEAYYGIVEALNSLVPFVICGLLSVLLIRTLNRTDATLAMTTNVRRRTEQKRISAMLLGITLWFIFCTCPSLVCRMSKPQTRSTDWVKFRGIADMFLLLNHTANFVLYAATSKSYRQHFIDIILCRNRRALERELTIARNVSMRSFNPNTLRAAREELEVHYTPIAGAR